MRTFILTFAVILLVGCASHPHQASSLTIVARCPAYMPTLPTVLDALRDHHIEPSCVSGGWASISVPDASAAEAREILSRLVANENFKGLEIVK